MTSSYFSFPSFIICEVGFRCIVWLLEYSSMSKSTYISEELTRLDHFIQRVFAGFKRWDAVHMLHIAQHEYVFESSLGCFLIAAALLYRIVLRVSRSVKQAVIAVLLFSANPASIFFSAAYSESQGPSIGCCYLTISFISNGSVNVLYVFHFFL
ncbi:unnamed protein product [Haemonchus placei]|uniref:GPI mannosyltransferase 2 n=1 Tax=Haemonchus placei TaxID=6290 RepID=A0A3P7TBJ8_HAEPC|nr:unnamed protein product [Haemonchus placei]